ncbi:MAG: DUF4760 domain-containing protein [Promethearchaeota archaeon]|jgi:hypothetical protein
MISIENVLDVIPAVSVAIALVYYAMNLRQQNKQRETQWIWQLLSRKTSHEVMSGFLNQLSAKWEDYDEYLAKYDSSVDPEFAAIRQSSWYFFDILGIMVKQKKIDLEMIYPFYNMHILLLWFKYETVIKVLREGIMDRDYMEGLEFLVEEMIRMRKERGLKIPTALLHPTSSLIQEHM